MTPTSPHPPPLRSIAVDDEGAMYTWGWGAYAQLMHGDRK
jgi:alpha-tubulin suppressor-like RCC1 family protein